MTKYASYLRIYLEESWNVIVKLINAQLKLR